MFELNGIFREYKEEKHRINNSRIKTFLMFVGFILFVFVTEWSAKRILIKLSWSYMLSMNKLLLLQLSFTIFPILYVLFVSKTLFKHKIENLGFSKNNLVKDYALGALIGVLMFASCVLIGVILGFQRITLNSGNISYSMTFLFLLGFLIQGMSEEVVLRGWLFPEMSSKFGVLTGIVFNSIIFSLIHSGNPNISIVAYINLFLFGIFESFVYYRWQNLWITGAIHSLWNFSQGNIFGIQVSGIDFSASRIFETKFLSHPNFTGGNFGTEGGLICTFVLIVFLIIILYMIKADKKKLEY